MLHWPTFGLLFGLFVLSSGYPIDPRGSPPIGGSALAITLLGITFLIVTVLAALACACCRQSHSGFKPKEETVGEKEFRNSTGSLNQQHEVGFTNRLACSELAIFPPPGTGSPRSQILPPTSVPSPTKPVAFTSPVTDVSDWFLDPNGNFPRQQLFYQREIGKGWFGKVVEGEARGTKVVVRILREDATPEERAHFLHEARPFRDLRHRNLAHLYAFCLDQHPYLLLFEIQTNGDLKSFLVSNSGSRSVLTEQGISLRMMTDVAEGLNYMIENGFIHTDLAARNCLVSSDLTVKIGDYGASIDLYKDEYYITENVAVPIRWCAPETVHCTPTTIETKQVTAASNVWSLGVLLWEVAEFGRLPYENLTDDQVIIRVFGGEKLRLPRPNCPYAHYLYTLLQLCWRVDDRVSLSEVLTMLHRLRSCALEEGDFERRWEELKRQSPRHTQLAQRPRLVEFDSGVDLEAGTPSPLLKSPSLTNLQGSLDDVWTQEDDNNVSQAIQHLDDTLASAVSSRESSSTDTEDETWRNRLERGEFTEKVKEKSKSVTDLMVLTHIESEGSETDSLPSLTRQYSIKKNGNITYTSVGFGSEGNIRNAVLSEELRDRLRGLSLWKTDDPQSFLVKVASEMNKTSTNITSKQNHKRESKTVHKEITPVNNQTHISKVMQREVESCTKFINNNVDSSCDLQNENNGVHVNKSRQVEEGIDESLTESSQEKLEKLVPEIVVTEPNLPEQLMEPEEEINLECLVKSIPRKFVFVCNDSDQSDETDSNDSSTHDDSLHSNSDLTEVTFIPPCARGSDSSAGANESTVILGSCEEYTLDYFKGLKTTFVPLETYSDEESEPVRERKLSEETSGDLESPCSGNGLTMFDEESSSETRTVRIGDSSPNMLEDDTPVEETSKKSIDALFCRPEGGNLEADTMAGEKYTLTFESPGAENLNFNTHDITSKLCDDLTTVLLNSPGNDISKDNYLSDSESLIACGVHHSLHNESQKHTHDTDFLENDIKVYDKRQRVLNEKNMLQNNCPKLIEGLTNHKNTAPTADFKMSEIISEDVFAKQSNYDTYFSIDSGHSSDRCSEQEHQLNDLKNRLEDVANFAEDFQLKRSEEEYGGKLHTPDDERSSDSGFRDKGSLSESVEDTCDEKYNLEDIDAELDDFNMKPCEKDDFKYYEQVVNETEPERPKPQTLEGWFLHPQTLMAEGTKENGWLSQSTENEEKPRLSIADEFAAAIRNELTEKLPCALQMQRTDEDTSPEQERIDQMVQFIYPAQLSPIIEEQESNQSSLILDDNSPLFQLEPPKPEPDTFKEDIIKALECVKVAPESDIIVQDLEIGSEIIYPPEKFAVEDDVLVVDTETNQVTLIESPKPQSHLAFVGPRRLNENFKDVSDPEDEYNDESINSETYNLSSDNMPFTPDISLGSNTFSSPENGVLSGFFLSPCSVRSDLFDSGPPSLPFDLGQSIEEVEEISLCKPNNEAVEIEQELKEIGVLKKEFCSSESLEHNAQNVFKRTELVKTEVQTFLESNSTPPSLSSTEILENEVLTSGKDRRDLFLNIPQAHNVDLRVSEKSSQDLVDSQQVNLPSEPQSSTENSAFFTAVSQNSEEAFDVNKVSDDAGSRQFLDILESRDWCANEKKILPSPEDRKHPFLELTLTACQDPILDEDEKEDDSFEASPDGNTYQADEHFKDGSLVENILSDFEMKYEPIDWKENNCSEASESAECDNLEESAHADHDVESDEEDRSRIRSLDEMTTAFNCIEEPKSLLDEDLSYSQNVDLKKENLEGVKNATNVTVSEQLPGSLEFQFNYESPRDTKPLLEFDEDEDKSLLIIPSDTEFLASFGKEFVEEMNSEFINLSKNMGSEVFTDLKSPFRKDPPALETEKLGDKDDKLPVTIITTNEAEKRAEVTISSEPSKDQDKVSKSCTPNDEISLFEEGKIESKSEIVPSSLAEEPNKLNFSVPELNFLESDWLKPDGYDDVATKVLQVSPKVLIESVKPLPTPSVTPENVNIIVPGHISPEQCLETSNESIRSNTVNCTGDIINNYNDILKEVSAGAEIFCSRDNEAWNPIEIGDVILEEKVETIGKCQNEVGSTQLLLPTSDRLENVAVVAEELPRHRSAEEKIDLLLESQDASPKKETSSLSENQTNVNQVDWLQELLLQSNSQIPTTIISFDSSGSDWPTVEELIPEETKDTLEVSHEIKQKQGITSTLALTSPDLSLSTDSSKSHSLLSSFSSTPTCDDKKFVQEKQPSPKLQIPNVETSCGSTEPSESKEQDPNFPLPSPEDADKGWRPTIGQLLELTDQIEGEEMTTSFIEPDENGMYTPDWESDTSEEQSSSSSEFFWKEGDKEVEIKAAVVASDLFSPQESLAMERIVEEDEKEEESSDDGSCSEGSGTEFVPSTWDSSATPSKSAIRSPNNTVKIAEPTASEKKRVMFKKEKYQCVYEYPREPSDDEDDESETWQTPSTSYNYTALTDWELGDGEYPLPMEGDSDPEEMKNHPRQSQDIEFYRLDYDIGSSFDEGEFFISAGGEGSEFFPGREDVADCEDENEFRPGASDIGPRLGELRHTKDQLRLELPSLRPPSVLDSGISSA